MTATKRDVHRLQAEVERLTKELAAARAKPPVERVVEVEKRVEIPVDRVVEVEKIVRRPTLEQEAEIAFLRAENDRLNRELQAR